MANPLLNEKAFAQTMLRSEGVMTLQGTINKTFFLLLLCAVGGMFSWNHYQALSGYTTLIALATFVVAMIIIFRKTSAPLLTPVYALGKGLVLGVVSAAYNQAYHGIVAQAVCITFLVFGLMLFIYRTGLIKVNRTFLIAITAATGAIALFYIISLVMSAFGHTPAYFTSNSGAAIAVNVVICLVAAFNFLIDFKFIDTLTSEVTAPKYMEWYAGFSLIITLVWLYIEILQLLGRMNRR